MDITVSDRVALLKSIHLFKGAPDEQLLKIALELQVVDVPTSQRLYTQGDTTDFMYFVYSGNVMLMIADKGHDKEFFRKVRGDYFGIEAATNRRTRWSSADVNADTVLLALHHDFLKVFLKEIPQLSKTLDLIVRSRKIAHALQFNWLEDGEYVYMMTVKHPILLLQALLPPIFVSFLPAAFLFFQVAVGEATFVPGIVAAVLIFLIFLWVVWIILDLQNDFYIITNRRIVWVEKIIALYDSRQESPLSMILSVSVETGFWGRILDYGDVIIRTYTSQIVFHFVPHFTQVKDMIEEYRARQQATQKEHEKEAMKNAIRSRLGLEQPISRETKSSLPRSNAKKSFSFGRLMDLWANLWQLRTIKAGSITYRKHWVIMLKQTWLPGTLMLGVIILFGLSFLLFGGQAELLSVIGILLIIFVFVFLWWLYEYVDYRNDRFVVTPEQILDIDKRPLGLEEKKSAKLEDILSVEYRRVGLLGIILNFGTVSIKVGTTTFTFDDVYDPASVQMEVEYRRNARITKKNEDENTRERNRLADWLITYHRTTEELRDMRNKTRLDDNNG